MYYLSDSKLLVSALVLKKVSKYAKLFEMGQKFFPKML